jgi:UDP-N-acetylmuramoyl-tripeptide--D-alanyl-D-alanine ligase
MEGRQEIFETKGMTIIKDCYNAGPESMAAALNVLKNRPGRRIAVLGDMLELGDRTREEHEKVGALAASCADVLLSFGPSREYMIAGAVAAGMKPENTGAFESREDMAQSLRQNAAEGDVLLFKGSHGMHMELVLEQFLKEER